MEAMNDDMEYLRAAMREAGAAEAAGEVPVGAVVVYRGEVIARGQNRVLRDHDPTGHAEMVALRQAGRELGNYRLAAGCALYVTLEPCAMCAGAILHARISRLVYGAADAKAGACGSIAGLGVMNHPALNHRVEVVEGVMGDECGAMLTNFFRARR
jgi:tRNA(adenine34) deaminase